MDLSPYQLIVFDVDGTLRRCTIPGQPCPNKPGEWELLPGVKEVFATFSQQDIMIGVATNQAGIAAGFLTWTQCQALLAGLFATLGYWPLPGAVQVCPHAVDAGCICRKPEPGMLYAIMQEAGIYRKAEVLYVGDMASDEETARRMGIAFVWAKDFFGWEPAKG